MAEEHPEARDSFWRGHPSEMGKAVGEVVGQCRPRGDLGHGVEGEGRRRMDQSEGPGRGALEGHNQDRGPGKGILTHWVEEGYACNPEEHTVVAVGRSTLRNKWQIIINITSLNDFLV